MNHKFYADYVHVVLDISEDILSNNQSIITETFAVLCIIIMAFLMEIEKGQNVSRLFILAAVLAPGCLKAG